MESTHECEKLVIMWKKRIIVENACYYKTCGKGAFLWKMRYNVINSFKMRFKCGKGTLL